MKHHVAGLLAEESEEALSALEQQRVREHVATCADCSDLQARLRTADRLIAEDTALTRVPPLRYPVSGTHHGVKWSELASVLAVIGGLALLISQLVACSPGSSAM